MKSKKIEFLDEETKNKLFEALNRYNNAKSAEEGFSALTDMIQTGESLFNSEATPKKSE